MNAVMNAHRSGSATCVPSISSPDSVTRQCELTWGNSVSPRGFNAGSGKKMRGTGTGSSRGGASCITASSAVSGEVFEATTNRSALSCSTSGATASGRSIPSSKCRYGISIVRGGACVSLIDFTRTRPLSQRTMSRNAFSPPRPGYCA